MTEQRAILKKRITGFVKYFVPLVFICGMMPRCANIVAPQGGPRDTLPPVVVDMRPAFGTKNFTGKRIYIEFDEYVKLADLQREFFTSPFMETKPSVLVRGRGIQIDIKDTLAENTTYSLNFASSIQDNNEGNPLHGLRYVFSTGDQIDSMIMSGYTVDGFTSDSVSKAFIFFYEAWRDTVPGYDSLMFNANPDKVARAQPNGIFLAENLKPVDYRVYALLDNNSNQKYEPGIDRIAFLDTIYNPANMPPFDVWYDTTRLYLVADPQLYFRLFTDDIFRRQYLAGRNRPQQRLMVLNFGAADPQIEKLEFSNIDTTLLVREYLKPTRDSIAYWIGGPADMIPDTVRGEVIYLKHDSINELVRDTQQLNLVWRFVETRQQERERERKEKEREEAIARGEEVEPEPNPFKVKVEGGSSINPEKNIPFVFDYPLVSVDSARINFWRIPQEGDTIPERFSFTRDTLNMRTWYFDTDWRPTQKYKLEIPSGVFFNIAGESNDTLRSEMTVLDPDKYATVVFNVIPKGEGDLYILQLLSKSGTMLQEKKFAGAGRHVFSYVDPGDVRLRIIEDDNGNGEWDTGNLVERRQPERVAIFFPDTGDDIIVTKMNWEMEFDIDMGAVFAPVTMESVKRDIRRLEMLRIQREQKEAESRSMRPDNRVQDRGDQNSQNPFGNQGQFGSQGQYGSGGQNQFGSGIR